MMYKHNKTVIIFLLCCIGKLLFAQDFKVKATLNTVASTGFYKIPVHPELTAHTKTDLSDLRIIDQSYKQVPFIIRHSLPLNPGGVFMNFQILKTTIDSLSTTIEIVCPLESGTDRISLHIGNNAVERIIFISGSNDRKQWYIIEEGVPFSRYSYYKLVIRNGHSDPLNIIKAGVYTNNKDTGTQQFTTNPPVSFVQRDSSNGCSYITVTQKDFYHLDRVALNIHGPKYYKRAAHLYNLDEKGNKIHLTSFEILNSHSPVVSFGTVKAKQLLIEVENKDDPPLVIERVSTEQSSKYLVAYLEKRKNYFIVAGNEDLKAPEYDLQKFSDSIPNLLASISYHDLRLNGEVSRSQNKMYWSQWLWPVIILFLFALGFLTYKLMADMKRSGF
ncbi:hypothetical protein OCK74_23750 [Chitinophagaceae bacterium LB-8]|uniref:DUF3999 family protein n=1 Tax=Paraflavisolibacter caeni TaxID=2982496 RepID=A0A9X2XYZ1_9BACT|nr:hypothetical protein [Paraflavisolibacter caeni]MCU7552154.1 hypothetical protein [Paraflavisolibacter caeni]